MEDINTTIQIIEENKKLKEELAEARKEIRELRWSGEALLIDYGKCKKRLVKCS